MDKKELDLLFGKKGKLLCDHFFTLYRRFPKFFPKALLRGVAGFISICSDEFIESRDIFVLSKILFSLFRLNQTLTTQKINLKILEITPYVYGITISIFPMSDQEFFEEKHLLKGIKNLIPGVKNVPDSYLYFQKNRRHFFYIEIKKVRGGIFSSAEKKKLQADLHLEFQHRIESLTHSLIVPGNEEEVFKNILQLSKQLKYIRDCPQVMITFVEYVQEALKFLIIVLRVLKPDTPSIPSLSSSLPSMLQFNLENVLLLDKIRNKYPKEAALFTIEVNCSLFLRDNNAVNLRNARQYIVKSLESMLGPFRDYNGGLLQKENEQLIAIRKNFTEKKICFPKFEDLFYGIKPISLRTLILPQTGVDLAHLFNKIVDYPLDTAQKYHLEFATSKDAHIAIIKTKEKEWKMTFSQQILNSSSQIGFSSLEHNEHLYLCFFHQYPQAEILFNCITKTLLQDHFPCVDRKRALLRMNFQGGEPSSLNPRLAADLQGHILSNFLFEGLMRINSKGEVVNALAERVEISQSRTMYTFYLRSSLWSNGEEVTAYHFEHTWKKTLMASASPAGWIYRCFSPIKNAKQVMDNRLSLDTVGIAAKDAKTLCVELEAPCPFFLNLMTTPPFFPLFGESEEPMFFNGPFTLAEWNHDVSLSLSQNPFYWDAQQIGLGGIKILMLRDPDIAYDLFKRGELDIVGDPTSPLSPQILKSSEVRKNLHYKEISRIFIIHCNTRTFPLNNVFFRRALSLALNREQLTKRCFIEQIPHFSILPPKYSSLTGNMEGDLEKAQICFQKALDEFGIDAADLPPLLITHSDLSFEKPLIAELKAQWEENLGITIETREKDWNDFSSALERGNFELAGLFRRDLYNDPFFYLSFFQPSPFNSHSWDNREYERLLTLYSQEENPTEIIKKIEQLIMEEVPAIPLVNQRYLILQNERIKGMHWNENGCLDLNEAWINETSNHILSTTLTNLGMSNRE